MERRFWIVLVVIVAILGGVFVLSGRKQPTKTTSFKTNGNLNTVQSYDHVRGSKAGKVTLVEYGDFQCPYCGAYSPVGEQAYAKYGSAVTFVFRDFPLTQLHPNAFAAARAAEAAGKQGKFWQMHDKLYSNQREWADNTQTASDVFKGYAKDLGLNIDQFSKDYSSEDINNIINNFTANGTSQNVTGTPTLILNGKKINPPQSLQDTAALKTYYSEIEKTITDAGLKVPTSSSSSAHK